MNMENASTSTQVDFVIKPVFLKTGIPLAFAAAAGFILARITRRKCPNHDASKAEKHIYCQDEVSLHDLERLDSSNVSCLGSDHSDTETNQGNSEREAQDQRSHELEEEVLLLRDQVKNLHVRELELKIEHFHYRDLKGQETVAMEVEKMLLLEITRAQIMEKDISSAEAERQRFQMAIDYQKIYVLLQLSRSRNRLLQRRINKLLRKTSKQRQFIEEQNKKIEAAEKSAICQELKAKSEIIRKMEDEIREKEVTLVRLQEEKNDLSNQMELANQSALLKIEAEKVKMEDNYREVASKLEELESQRAMETEELIYLRWCNACLRHELMRKNQELQDPNQGNKKNQPMELKFGEIADLGFGSDDYEMGSHPNSENGHSCLQLTTTSGRHRAHSSRRKRFMEKFKRWMEGDDKEKHEHKLFGRHSVPHSPDHQGHITHARRKSFSSA
ncbi:OLC1v1034384C1 [Oldenlandia corymbosa var. corymbosa]|uniref:OLC1v1034384C1 n=1 Tax=Oldenlandia corymbosa var. corymbosa TaxID=529605 RepID=A0AAV1CQN3_OLDCO|nr:OLC1v1034384C1 [Oldenlandia corymbosa var. corymbosa]